MKLSLTLCKWQVTSHQLVLASISPMLYSEFMRLRYDDRVVVSLPDLSLEHVTQYLRSVYQGQDLSNHEDINNMLGFMWVKDSNNQDIINNKNMKAENNDSDEEPKTLRKRRRREYLDVWDYCEVDLKSDEAQSRAKQTKMIVDQGKQDKAESSEVTGTRKKRSEVWQHYVIDPSNSCQCVCQICGESVSYLNGGTSAMISHLKVDHKICVKTIGKKGVKKTEESRVKVKKEPALDPETGMIKKNVGKSRKKRRKDIWQHFNHFLEDNLKAECKICQQVVELRDKSSVSQTLVKHLNTHDIKLELETCSVCGKLFDEKNKRRKHENNHQAKCSCSYCGKLFSDNTARIVHERTHTGEKPYQVRI